MSRTILCLVGSLALSSIMTACSRTENKPPQEPASSATQSRKSAGDEGPPADVVQASVPQVELTAGGNTEATVTVKVANGYHINGNPASKFQIATELAVEPAEGITFGRAVYPQPESKKFSFSKEPILVYEGETTIKQPLLSNAGAAKGNRTLRGKLRVQPCDDTVCYPPRTLDVPIPVNVK